MISGLPKKPINGIILKFIGKMTKIQENSAEYDHETPNAEFLSRKRPEELFSAAFLGFFLLFFFFIFFFGSSNWHFGEFLIQSKHIHCIYFFVGQEKGSPSSSGFFSQQSLSDFQLFVPFMHLYFSF